MVADALIFFSTTEIQRHGEKLNQDLDCSSSCFSPCLRAPVVSLL
jgi:hypothetical protein